MNQRIDPYVAYRLQLLQEGQALRSFWERLGEGEPEARDRLAKFLHRLHGTSGTYGFDRVSALAQQLREAVVARPTRLLPEDMVEPLLAALLDASLGQGAAEPAAL
jgi:HPt (histidine-containing phosphotransfer) domain-containing protein